MKFTMANNVLSAQTMKMYTYAPFYVKSVSRGKELKSKHVLNAVMHANAAKTAFKQT